MSEMTPPHDKDLFSRSFREVFLVSLKLGVTCFGGPIAHLGYFHQEFVGRRKWIRESEYLNLIALCQFLPGPTSSQVNMIIGMARGGWRGAFAAWLGFTLPSALLMIGFGYEVGKIGDLAHAGWLEGLKLAAVAVIAQAVWNLGTKFCTKLSTATIAVIAAGTLLISRSSVAQVLVIFLGALAGWILFRHQRPGEPDEESAFKIPYGRKLGSLLLLLFLLLLLGLSLVRTVTGNLAIAELDGFYRTGSLVFGGGHVILPLLRSEVVPSGWANDNQFLAGYGAAQALPGPLFTFAAYLGVVMTPGPHRWIGGVGCLIAIFLPSFFLVFGVLPFWSQLRKSVSAQAALQGANAAVVGVLLSALYNPVWTSSVHGLKDLIIAFAAFALLQWMKLTPWIVVGLSALCGLILLG